MWEMIMNSSFVQTLIHCITVFMTSIVLQVVIGMGGFILGELFPRSLVHYDRFPYNEFKWEDGGRIYTKLKVNRWKDKVPDMSTFVKGMFYKKSIGHERNAAYFERFVKETCVAETVHIVLMFAGFLVFYFYHNAWGLFVSICFALGNVPFVLIQRYNRPRFKKIMERQRIIDAAQAADKAKPSAPQEETA